VTRVAAVDIGTNSTRLLVADVDGPDDELETVERLNRITRLGQDVDATRALRPEAIDRTVSVLREYRDVIDRLGADRLRATATSASRDASNREDFFTAARDALGVEPELISGDEEASLSFRGATSDLTAPSPFLVFDVGGGSTEFIVGIEKPDGLLSVDIGCVRLTERFLESDPPAPEELSAALSYVRDHLQDVDRTLPQASSAQTLVGLAGTITTMAAIELGLQEYDAEKIHRFRLSHDAAEDIFRTLATEPIDVRRHNPGLDPGRADVIVGGALVVVAVMRHWGFGEMLVSEADILDGLARSQL
jgi:exopolyphosphatase/guanosine-5'-triphosphate,3'-diphosphate pyrophosphatase